MKVDAISI